MKKCNIIRLLSFLSFLLSTDAFSITSNSITTKPGTQRVQTNKEVVVVYSTTTPKPEEKTSSEEEKEDDDIIQMKHDIEEMRLEAMERMQRLSTKMKDFDVSTGKMERTKVEPLVVNESDTMRRKDSALVDEGGITETLLNERMQREKSPSTASTASTASTHIHKDDLELLDETHWKIALNIGREAGSWMPKSWGASGERLLVNLEICFSKSQLYEREDFLGSVGGAKICRVIDQQCITGPTLSEGSRVFEVKDGGYRICQKNGPLGTDLLRFYIDVQETIEHTGSDVNCPKGRIYCTCGFFPENRGTSSLTKMHIRREILELDRQITSLEEQIANESNWIKKMPLMKQMFQFTNMDKPALEKKLLDAQVTEPDTALIRFSRRKDVALTKEGGLCCKVLKEAGRYEYHILGKFGVGAIEAREGHE